MADSVFGASYGDMPANYDANLTGGLTAGGNFSTNPDLGGFSLSNIFGDDNTDYSFGYTPQIGGGWNLNNYSGSGGFLNAGMSPDIGPFGEFFEENPFGRALKGLGKMALNATPAGRALNLGLGAMNFAKSPSVGKGIGLASQAIGGLPGATLNAAYQGSQGNWGPAAGTLAANVVGRATGSGELANMAGQFASNATKAGMGDRQGASPNQGFGGPEGNGMQGDGFDIAPVAQGLMSLYGMSQANRGIKDAGKMNSAVQDQISQLSSMFSPNSVYANHMREVLARKDAAAGRNSQYGPREAQLMALLAEKQAQAAGTIGSLANQGQANRFAAQDRRNQLLGQGGALLMNLGRQSGLFDMFRGNRGSNVGPDLAAQYGSGGPSTGYYSQAPSTLPYIPDNYDMGGEY